MLKNIRSSNLKDDDIAYSQGNTADAIPHPTLGTRN